MSSKATYDQLPQMPAGMIKVVIVRNGADHGVLGASVVARRVGLGGVHAAPAHHVLGRMTTTRIAGAVAPIDVVVREVAATVTHDVPMTTVPAGEGDELIAAAFGQGPPAAVKDSSVAAILADDLARAGALAAGAIERGVDVAEMRFQRAVVAMMRDDAAAAIAELERSPDDPRAASSLCQLYARRKDPRARALAARALEALPGDPIAIRAAILAHALTGDAAGARAVLAAHGAAPAQTLKSLEQMLAGAL